MSQSNIQQKAPVVAPVAEVTQPEPIPAEVAAKIAELQAQLEAVRKLGEATALPNGKPMTHAEVQAAIDLATNSSSPGNTSRPLIGLIHPVERVPIFNAMRPTGKGK